MQFRELCEHNSFFFFISDNFVPPLGDHSNQKIQFWNLIFDLIFSSLQIACYNEKTKKVFSGQKIFPTRNRNNNKSVLETSFNRR